MRLQKRSRIGRERAEEAILDLTPPSLVDGRCVGVA
jgi:hypothetical protein